MMRLLSIFLPPEKVAAKFGKRLRKAILNDNQQKTETVFCESFEFLVKKQQARLLSTLLLTYLPEIQDPTAIEEQISSAQLEKATALLKGEFDSAALMVFDLGGDTRSSMEILAKQGRADDLMARVTTGDVVDKALLGTAVAIWERYNGGVQKGPAMRDILGRIAKFAPEKLPNNPRVKEIAGQFQEAASLYIRDGELRDAARCYEKAGMYETASEAYEGIGDAENASRAAEVAGDMERALKLALNPERKAKLLIRTERLLEAREFAAGLESPDEYFDLIKERAKERMEARLKGHDFVGAIELADIAECEQAEREDILARGRQYFDRKIASAESDQDIQAIYRKRVKFEERAGQFEKAGQIAKEVLGDLDLASRLYEKANLFDRAIGTASGLVRLAELHEKGGNLLKAAQVYESVERYDQAWRLYEESRHFRQAVECYLKTEQPSQDVLLRLYTQVGEFEKVVEIYLKSGTLADLEKALSIATTHQLPSHARVIKEKIQGFVSGSEEDLEWCLTEAEKDVLGTYSHTIGIDFGTTNSVVAIFDKRTAKVEIVPAPGGAAYLPSFFGVDEDHHPIFGNAARLRAMVAPQCAIARVKRSLGEKKSFSVGGTQYRSEEIVAHLLQHFMSNAQAYIQSKVETKFHDLLRQRNFTFPAAALQAFLNKHTGSYHIQDVVLSVPAYFNDNQKRATRDAAEIAGLHVRRLLHEPSAAALAYGYQKPYSGKLAVIDLGGGTLDISIVEIGEGVHDVLTIGGDTALGGSDIDDLLVKGVTKDIRERWGMDLDPTLHANEIARLRDACEKLKINLSSQTRASLELRYFLNRPEYTFTLTRAELEHLAGPVLARIRSTIKETIKDFGSRIDHFLLVGNATKMPAVRDLVRKTLSAKQLAGIDPGIVVATGAALQGAVLTGELSNIVLLDIVPYSLGIAVMKELNKEETIARLIERNTTIPVKKSDIFTTRKDNQPNVHIRVYQGESPQPHKNHLLGDFVLDVPPAPAHEPKVEVTFDIGVDCILTVTAVDKSTQKPKSIRIEGAVMLSPREKEKLRNYFAQRQRSISLEKVLTQTRADIEALPSSCDEAIQSAERTIQNFFTLFRERIEINPHLYTAQPEQISEIQDMFIQKDQFIHGIPQYRDQLTSVLANIRQIEARHLDFSDKDIAVQLRERIDALYHYKQALESIPRLIDRNVTAVVEAWIQILESMKPKLDQFDPVKLAGYYLTTGQADKAKEILESQVASAEGLTEDAFHLLLRSQLALGLRDEYINTHKRFGSLFGMIYPDFNRLDSHLKTVEESVFMILVMSGQHIISSGSGFCAAPNLIVTNRHVVEKAKRHQIKIVGKDATFTAIRLEMDPLNDLAVLRVRESLKPLKLGEFGFVEPGEPVLALGFLSPNSNVYSENIYISKGIVNSIRKIDVSAERVIFIDAKIGNGMSGGPLINELGQVVGIMTLVYGIKLGKRGTLHQPVALPIHLVKKHLGLES